VTKAPVIAAVVEGEGEVAALPVLLRRIMMEMHAVYVHVPPPARLSRGKLTLERDIARAIHIQAKKVDGRGGVLVLLDADDDCPVECAGAVRDCCLSLPGCPVEVVVANREFEAWFLASVESLRDHWAVAVNATYAGDPEQPRGAKERLAKCMTEKYVPTLHQAAFAQMLDLSTALARSRSFRRLASALERLINPAT
jgi:hypothetical protein